MGVDYATFNRPVRPFVRDEKFLAVQELFERGQALAFQGRSDDADRSANEARELLRMLVVQYEGRIAPERRSRMDHFDHQPQPKPRPNARALLAERQRMAPHVTSSNEGHGTIARLSGQFSPRLIVLAALETTVNGFTAREVEHALISKGETRLSAGLVEATLVDLAHAGEAAMEGPLDCRSFLIVERGRERLRAGRA